MGTGLGKNGTGIKEPICYLNKSSFADKKKKKKKKVRDFFKFIERE